METEHENKLIEAAKANPQAFEALYVHYHDRVYRFVWAKVRDLDLAADICSETFMKVWLGIRRYNNQGVPFTAWLFRIATNEINQHFRKHGGSKYVSIHPDMKGEWDMHLEKTEAREKLAQVLEKLSTEDLRLIEWRFFDGFAFKEIADMETSTEAAVKMKVYRILDFLKEQLKYRG